MSSRSSSASSAMTVLRGLTMTLAFGLELAMLVAFFVWAVSAAPAGPLQFVAGIGVTGLVMAVWGVFLAPRSERRLRHPWLIGAEAVLFGLAALGLMLVGRVEASVAFAVAAVLRFALGGISGLDRADRATRAD